jgi:hypothetical protein
MIWIINDFTFCIGERMAIIHNPFLRDLLDVHDKLRHNVEYPFFDPACVYYEAVRAELINGIPQAEILSKYGLTMYQFKKALSVFYSKGVTGLLGLRYEDVVEPFDLEVERVVYVLKNARPWIPATKMVTVLKGFGHSVDVDLLRRLYASYGWAQGTKKYKEVNFEILNLKVAKLSRSLNAPVQHFSFFEKNDNLQSQIEVFRTLGITGITQRFSGSRVSFGKYKSAFQSIGMLGLLEGIQPPFRNSKLGFKEEGSIVLSKIQSPDKTELDYRKMLLTKNIDVSIVCIKKIFSRWKVAEYDSAFIGDLERLLDKEKEQSEPEALPKLTKKSTPIHMNIGFVEYIRNLTEKPAPLANPGIFLFLPLLNRLKIFEMANTIMEVDPKQGYSWFSLLMLNLGRIFAGISSVSKASRVEERSLPLSSGLVEMPCNDTILNGIAAITEEQLYRLRRYLTGVSYKNKLIKGSSIALDFHMRDFHGEDANLKNIGKGPSPKKKICFPGFRPHLAWDLSTGVPISLEFRNGKARATTTFTRFIKELIPESLGEQNPEHIFLDSEYTAQKVWSYVVDSENGLGADLTMCIKRNKAVSKHIDAFLKTDFIWLYYDEKHTYSGQTFSIPINGTNKVLQCVLKRHEKNGRLRCFGSTILGLEPMDILREYSRRWIIENGIKDLVRNYFFDNIPGTDPHRINIHYFVVTLARILFQMFCNWYSDSKNSDGSQKEIDTIRPEFLVGTNASISRNGSTLTVSWQDEYREEKHGHILSLFEALNGIGNEALPFLGGLKLKFKLSPPKDEDLKNGNQRVSIGF